ncbi:uncharacterized protein C8Q71DRAFT_860391 [Rhodofomes roseus]|uniref:Uncharacterized protein n=1 Tax=Rhodofomes roseus TaxID=34475 RepID=A0ABQ8K7F1_9APHY|nr:uncharacterized protein C8Q71DRAFT_860391 [Rhodofomes roseus]KAH9833102.1 hypothetical protein C8Q71DRAFT_860391 [Rhodofomes roseus]
MPTPYTLTPAVDNTAHGPPPMDAPSKPAGCRLTRREWTRQPALVRWCAHHRLPCLPRPSWPTGDAPTLGNTPRWPAVKRQAGDVARAMQKRVRAVCEPARPNVAPQAATKSSSVAAKASLEPVGDARGAETLGNGQQGRRVGEYTPPHLSPPSPRPLPSPSSLAVSPSVSHVADALADLAPHPVALPCSSALPSARCNAQAAVVRATRQPAPTRWCIAAALLSPSPRPSRRLRNPVTGAARPQHPPSPVVKMRARTATHEARKRAPTVCPARPNIAPQAAATSSSGAAGGMLEQMEGRRVLDREGTVCTTVEQVSTRPRPLPTILSLYPLPVRLARRRRVHPRSPAPPRPPLPQRPALGTLERAGCARARDASPGAYAMVRGGGPPLSVTRLRASPRPPSPSLSPTPQRAGCRCARATRQPAPTRCSVAAALLSPSPRPSRLLRHPVTDGAPQTRTPPACRQDAGPTGHTQGAQMRPEYVAGARPNIACTASSSDATRPSLELRGGW